MKKRLRVKWKNVIAVILMADVIRTIFTLALNTTTGLTMFGFIVLLLEVFSISILTE